MTTDIKDINPEELQNLKNKDQVIHIDVREVDEFEEDAIEGSINIPLGTLTIDKINNPDNKIIVFSCQSGVRSKKACYLIANDLPNSTIYNLKGGIIAWNNANK